MNKGISSIQYNVLNLPNEVLFDNGATQTYHYTADGEKWRTVYTAGLLLKDTVDYCGGAIIENGVLKKLLTPVGYVDMSGTTPSFYYYLKDHQGNNRVVVNSSGTVQETNHYYPFGGLFATNGSVQDYKYNGKEWDDKTKWYDYGARHYDATLGRWHVVDPLAEKYYSMSSYGYCANNPINRIDPIGMEWEDVEEAERLKKDINDKIQSLERSIAKKQFQLDSENINEKKAKKLYKQINEDKERISYLQISLDDIDLLGNDKNNVYVFSKINGGEHHVKRADDGRILIETSSDAISLHEISHLRQSLKSYGKLLFSPNGYLYNAGRTSEKLFSQMEIEAYRIQYSYDLSFPGNLYKKGIHGIDAKSIGNIYNPNTGKYVYEIIRKYSLKLK